MKNYCVPDIHSYFACMHSPEFSSWLSETKSGVWSSTVRERPRLFRKNFLMMLPHSVWPCRKEKEIGKEIWKSDKSESPRLEILWRERKDRGQLCRAAKKRRINVFFFWGEENACMQGVRENN